jgi:hypothetical protein
VDGGLIRRFWDRKNFSHRRNNFPSTDVAFRLATHQGTGEFETQEVVTIHVGYPYGSGTQDARSFGEGISGN